MSDRRINAVRHAAMDIRLAEAARDEAIACGYEQGLSIAKLMLASGLTRRAVMVRVAKVKRAAS